MKKTKNPLEFVPMRSPSVGWSQDGEGIVTLKIANKGIFNYIFQILLKKPRYSYIHLDEQASFVWVITDGEKDIMSLAREVKERFGESAEPLYERLIKYYKILQSYGFVRLKKVK